MIIKKTTTTTAALTGTLLALTLVAAPLHAAGENAVASDPTVDNAANGTEMTPEELEMAAEKAEAEAEKAAMAIKEGAEEAGEAIEAGAETAAAAVVEAANDDETAAMIQQRIGTEPSLGNYALDVIEMDGRYTVNGMIDKSEDYATLQQILADVDGVDPAMIDNNVVQN